MNLHTAVPSLTVTIAVKLAVTTPLTWTHTADRSPSASATRYVVCVNPMVGGGGTSVQRS